MCVQRVRADHGRLAMSKTKRIFTFPSGLPDDAELMNHLLSALARVVGKDAPELMQRARADLTVVTQEGTSYHAQTFIEVE